MVKVSKISGLNVKKGILYNDEMEPELYIEDNKIYEYKISSKENFYVYKNISEIDSEHLKDIKILSKFEESFVYAEEYIYGDTLTNVLKNEELSKAKAKRLIHELIDAAEELHTKLIIHRDIKPDNIIISDAGKLVLIDYNISRIYKESKQNDTTLFGTKGYAPPEQFGFGQTDVRADYFPIGKVIELIAQNSGLELSEVIKNCTYFDPNNRYSSIEAIRKDIDKSVKIKLNKNTEHEVIDFSINGFIGGLKQLIWPHAAKDWSLKRRFGHGIDLFSYIMLICANISVMLEDITINSIFGKVFVLGYILILLYISFYSFIKDACAMRYLKLIAVYIVGAAILETLDSVIKIF